ncbi:MULTISPECIES: SHOCT domain-containing protein [unclassified Synechococcus]|uniref:SHOCT domain-containing protein n=1 Tax=unclassified Synechococcus TaxID=2626047 RepID=UPI0021A25C5F|nr:MULTISPECIES: SHOCT domain-containing protein [unclassified Synechococcus]MCT0212520.1 SHOCT domain-containing protein [Synechococcus sp. CS-1326]MCT0232037.1 SHOCT domain-containing protein [Synechococcus sp. CS-1327]
MEKLTAAGLEVVNDLAQRYGFSQDAVLHMAFALLKGRGGMAQFNHPEFAGSGQWMNGGMMMLGDMFNHGLKARVDGLCQDLSTAISSQPELFPRGSFQSQSQSGGAQQMLVGGAGLQQQSSGGGQQMQVNGGMAPLRPMSFGSGALFTPDPRDTWWPAELGAPSSSGAQNDVRYAYFPAAGRLAVEVNGHVSVYDTSGHQIAGISSQQQSSGGGLMFSTGEGNISLAHLNLTALGTPAAPAPQATQSVGGRAAVAEPTAVAARPASAPPANGTDVFATLERLGELMQKGILTEEEFAAKKAELLSRL